jgi:tellurium resistance protein TerD
MMGGHVFVSYAREDEAYVDTLVRYLRGQGVEVWTDTAIYFGDRWSEVIEEKIDSCAAFVVVMSPAARESAWVDREVLHALEQGKRVFPLLLSGRKLFVVGNLQYEDVGHGGMPTQRWVGVLRAAMAGAGSVPAPAGGGVPHAGAPPTPGTRDVPTPDESTAETAKRRWWQQLLVRQPSARMSRNPVEAVGQPPRLVGGSVSLSRGGNVSLTKEAPGLTDIVVGLGWDVRTAAGVDFDLDARAIACRSDGKVASDAHFVFFNNLRSPDGAIEHTGDHLTGEGEGDDEQIKVNLAGMHPKIDKVVFLVSIYDADARWQSFGQVRNAFIRIVDAAGGGEIARYDLTEDASAETAMVFGEVYRRGADWNFRAVGRGYASGLVGVARDFGVNV